MKPLKRHSVLLKTISTFLIVFLNFPYACIFAGQTKDKILFLGVLDKDNAWLNAENLKWLKMSFPASKYTWESAEPAIPFNIEKIAEECKQENIRKIIYGKIQEAEISKNKNGVAVTASFYVYDTASKDTREIALTGISPQKPGYSGSEELLYNEALKDLSMQLVSVLDENVSPAERNTKKLAKKKTKKSSSHRHSYFEDDNVFGSDLLDMLMGAGLLYMVFFRGKDKPDSNSSGASTSTLSCPPATPSGVEAPPWCYLTSSQGKVFHPTKNNDGSSNGNCKSNSLSFSSQKEACNAGYRPSETDFDLSGLYNQWSACGIIKSDNTADTSQCSQFP